MSERADQDDRPDGVTPATQYAHVLTATGRFVAVAGQLAIDEHGAVVGEGDPGPQARQVLENLRRPPAAVGATFDDVVEPTCFTTDMGRIAAIRGARGAHTPDDRLPAASAVQVAAPVRPDIPMGIEAFAVPGA
ncbi:Rid family hydrolase [Streptomyces sp. NPDC001500]